MDWMTSESLPSLHCSKSPFPHRVTQSGLLRTAACPYGSAGGLGGALGMGLGWGLQTMEGGAGLGSGQQWDPFRWLSGSSCEGRRQGLVTDPHPTSPPPPCCL